MQSSGSSDMGALTAALRSDRRVTHGRDGDRESLAVLFGREYNSYLRTARAIIRNEDDARDVVQTACCAATKNLEAFRGASSFRTWMTRIVINCSLMHIRGRKCFASLDDELSGPARVHLTSRQMTPEQWTSYRETSAIVLRELPTKYRDPYYLYVFDGLSVEEIGEALGISVNAVKTRLHRARTRLRTSFRLMDTQGYPKRQRRSE